MRKEFEIKLVIKLKVKLEAKLNYTWKEAYIIFLFQLSLGVALNLCRQEPNAKKFEEKPKIIITVKLKMKLAINLM